MMKMSRVAIVLVVLAIFAGAAWAAKETDRVNSLPGLQFMPYWKMYSGYMTVDEAHGRKLFYWFVESQDNPSEDPLVVWMNGGPGCSSLLGFFTENGPYQVQDDFTLMENPWSWNKVANMIYLEAPAGVGFSYSNTPSDYVTGDNQTMTDNYNFLLQWFKYFPEYKTNDFYVSGESYGGHYVPQLAWTILNGNKKSNDTINLKGFAVGNAWTDDQIDTNSVPPFLYFHALISLKTWKTIQSSCGINGNMMSSKIRPKLPYRESFFPEYTSDSPACLLALAQMRIDMGTKINNYDIYTPCYDDGISGLACMNYTVLIDYLNKNSVKSAIHATAPFPWTVCSNRIDYEEQWSSVLPIYPTLMQNLRVTVYAGDVTFNVPFNGAEVWIQNFNRPIVSDWRPWLVADQTAGYMIKYDQITFVTVRDAGHMVPQYQPESAFFFFERYLRGQM